MGVAPGPPHLHWTCDDMTTLLQRADSAFFFFFGSFVQIRTDMGRFALNPANSAPKSWPKYTLKNNKNKLVGCILIYEYHVLVIIYYYS